MNAARGHAPAQPAGEHRVTLLIAVSQQAMWAEIMRRHRRRQAFTAEDIAEATGAAVESVAGYLRSLTRAGYAVKAGMAQGRRDLFQALAERLPPELDARGVQPKTEQWLSQMWRAIRMMGRFSRADLTSALTGVPASRLDHYLADLERAGYIRPEPGLAGGGGAWRLLAHGNTGPLAPEPMTARFLFDRNTGAVAGGRLSAEEARL